MVLSRTMQHQAHVYIPDELWQWFAELALKNRRSVSAEIVIAMERRRGRIKAEHKARQRKNHA